MGGIRTSLVVVCTSFVIGTLATHFVVDSLTLWQSPATDPHLYTAAQYYVLLASIPLPMIYTLSAITLSGALLILWSLGGGKAGNLMFDGGSLFLYLSAVGVYIYQIVPTIKDTFLNSHISRSADVAAKAALPTYLRKPVLDLAGSHLVCSVAMTGVIILQAGKWWAEGEDREWKDDATVAKPVPATETNAKVSKKKERKAD